jgi:hypothetical protein
MAGVKLGLESDLTLVEDRIEHLKRRDNLWLCQTMRQIHELFSRFLMHEIATLVVPDGIFLRFLCGMEIRPRSLARKSSVRDR